MPLGANNYYSQIEKKELWQGDLFRGIDFTYSSSQEGKDLSLAFPFPYAVVLTQACDLEQHYEQTRKNEVSRRTTPDIPPSYDKVLDTILLCPAFPHENFLLGKHIEERKMNDFDSPKGREKAYKNLKKNDSLNRYHYLPAFEEVSPELVIDFKRFHTVPIEIIESKYSLTHVSSLRELYRERLSQRFSNYLARIGLPDDSMNLTVIDEN